MRSVEIDWMRALVCVLSVTMPIWAPVMLIALWPSEWMAMAIRATLTCSPVESSMSISRAGGWSVICRARSMSRSVLSPMALTTTTTWLPCLLGTNGLAGRGQDLLAVGHAGAAEFLNDDGHGRRMGIGVSERDEKLSLRETAYYGSQGRYCQSAIPRPWSLASGSF